MKKYIIVFILASFLFTLINGQQLISTSGEYSNKSNGSISWSIGEVVTDTYSTENIIVTQGFQQGSIQVIPESTNEPNSIEMLVYPNPTVNLVNVKINTVLNRNFYVIIIDSQGRILSEKTEITNVFQVDLSSYPPDEYSLLIVDENRQKLSNFKIIKTQ